MSSGAASTAEPARGAPRIDRFGPGELRRLAGTGYALAKAGVLEVARRGPALALEPGRQPPRAVAAALRRAFEDLGPAYLKLGQVIASSPGLFPDVLAYEFRRCLDRVPPAPSWSVRRRIQADFGLPVRDLFDRFDDAPLASASIAQVHTAAVDGREVGVKVRRPGLVRRFRHDVRILHRMATGLDRLGGVAGVLNPVAVVEDFAATLFEEMDFRREAAAMERYTANLRAYGDNDGIRVPEVFREHTSERVLTMSREDGVPADRDDVIRDEWGVDVVPLFRRAIRSWVEAAFVHGFFHGDLHAGNLLVQADGTVVFLDFGIMGSFDAAKMRVLRELVPAVTIAQDWPRAARLVLALAPAHAPEVDPDAVAADMERIVGEVLRTPLWELSYGRIFRATARAAAGTGAVLPRELVLIAKQFLYFERYAKLLAPDYAVFGDPVIFHTLAGALAEGEGAGG